MSKYHPLNYLRLHHSLFAPTTDCIVARNAGRKSKGAPPSKPLHERLEEVERKKRERLLAAAAAEEARLATLTAPPRINPISAKIAAAAAASRPADGTAVQHRPKSASLPNAYSALTPPPSGRDAFLHPCHALLLTHAPH